MILSRELDAGRTLRILDPIAEALDTAHEAGLIHRDIKPQNVLVGGRDHPYLADFGLTKAAGDKGLTRTGQFVGTLDYISPEQIRGEAASKQSDVYSVATVLYECLTGVVPYPKDSEAAVLYAHMSDPPPKVTDARPELPAGLDEVIARAMAKDPSERHESATVLLQDAHRTFDRRMRAALTPPGPIEVPEETGIRAAEADVPTREGRAQDSEELAAAAGETSASPVEGPGATAATKRLGDETHSGDAPADATRASATPSQTQAGQPPAGATRPAVTPAGETRAASGTEQAAAAPPAARTRASRPPRKPTPTPKPPTTPSAAQTEERRRSPTTTLLAGAAALILALGLGAFLIGRSGGSSSSGGSGPASANVAAAGQLELGFPAGWRRLENPPSIPGLAFQDPIARGSAGGTRGVVAGRVNASGATLLPGSFQRTLGKAPTPDDAVRLGDLKAYRYADLRPRGFKDRLDVYVSPTTAGVATLACFAPRADSQFMAQCEDVAATLRLTGGLKSRPLGPNNGYAAEVGRALNRLNSARSAGRRRVRAAKSARAQGRAAAAVARAYRSAAISVSRAPAGPAERDVNRALGAALNRTAAAYRRLAAAARGGRSGAYRSAARTVRRGEQQVRREVQRLAALGYKIG